MKKSKFTETQIIGLLKQYDQGVKVVELCREYGISQPTLHSWKSKYGGMDARQLKRLKEFEIGKLFINSELLISTGNVGLNAVHFICYGTPVLTHKNFRDQMPEAETIMEGFNGLFHLENNIDSISEKINKWFSLHYTKWDREALKKAYQKIMIQLYKQEGLKINYWRCKLYQ